MDLSKPDKGGKRKRRIEQSSVDDGARNPLKRLKPTEKPAKTGEQPRTPEISTRDSRVTDDKYASEAVLAALKAEKRKRRESKKQLKQLTKARGEIGAENTAKSEVFGLRREALVNRHPQRKDAKMLDMNVAKTKKARKTKAVTESGALPNYPASESLTKASDGVMNIRSPKGDAVTSKQVEHPAQKGTKSAVDRAMSTPDIQIKDGERSPSRRKKTKHPRKQSVEAPASARVHSSNAQLKSKALGRRIRDLQMSGSPSWNVSPVAGGRFLVTDTAFTEDERFFALATPKAIHIYSVEDSLLLRSIDVNPMHTIVGFCLSTAFPDHMYVMTQTGLIIICSWATGETMGQWQPLHGRATSIKSIQVGELKRDTLFTTCEEADKDGRYHITYLQVRSRPESKWKHRRLWSSKDPIELLEVLGRGNIVIGATKNEVVIGVAKFSAEELSRNSPLTYDWHTLRCTEPIRSFAAHVRTKHSSSRKRKLSPEVALELDLAVGTSKGSIFVYEDVLSRIHQLEQNGEGSNVSAQPPRKLHWHREAVQALKWSRDGNYLISGGNETVLVLWQLETGKRQDLPHLAAPIVSIAVSPSGAAYAVQLADNSIMVLSTSELQPKAHVAGIQARTVADVAIELSAMQQRSSGDYRSDQSIFRPTPLVTSPRNVNQILLAVPSAQNQEASDTPPAAPFLQTYDTFSGRHVSRQALTRNNTTVVNVGPDGRKITEPSITHIQISIDGRWLATVEEWLPPLLDSRPFADDEESVLEKTESRRQTHLKFWLWNDEQQHWMLETRIDSPHQSPRDTTANRVFDLVRHPVTTGFATVGEDGFARTWRPKTSTQDGTVIRGARDDGIISWSCQHATELEQNFTATEVDDEGPAPAGLVAGRLAYSTDGSTLAAALESSEADSAGLVQFLDTATGATRHALPAMWTAGLAGLAFISRHLVVLSRDLRVWDVVTNTLAFGFELNVPSRLPPPLLRATSLLAATDAAFALALPTSDADGGSPGPPHLRSSLLVFDPHLPRPLFAAELSHLVSGLAVKGPGFVVLDVAAEVRTVAPATAVLAQPPAPKPVVEMQPAEVDGDADAAVAAAEEDEEEEEKMDDQPDDEEADKPVVRPQHLAAELDRGPAFALPNVRELFGRVLGLYGGRGRTT